MPYSICASHVMYISLLAASMHVRHLTLSAAPLGRRGHMAQSRSGRLILPPLTAL